MKKVAVLILVLALIPGSGMALAQTKESAPAQPQQPVIMPMCPCMMMQKQMTPEQMKQMQQWWQGCPMWQMMPQQQQPAQPQPKK